jgi:hypothetical protein
MTVNMQNNPIIITARWRPVSFLRHDNPTVARAPKLLNIWSACPLNQNHAIGAKMQRQFAPIIVIAYPCAGNPLANVTLAGQLVGKLRLSLTADYAHQNRKQSRKSG